MPSLSIEQRRAIAFRAATVYQRVAAFRSRQAEPTTDQPVVPDVAALRAWNQAFSPGDREAFLRRLSWDGLDWDTVGQALSFEVGSDNASAPEWFQLSVESDWTVWLDGILEQAADLLRDLETGALLDSDLFDPTNAAPFVELFEPACRTANDFLEQLHPGVFARVTQPARRELDRQLRKDVSFF